MSVGNGRNAAPPVIRAFAALLAIALMAAWTLAAMPDVSRPELAAKVHHAVADIEDHGFGHDDGDLGKHAGGHMLAHDSADHSHQLAFAAIGAAHLPDNEAGSWLTPPSQPIEASAVFGIERPPKGAPRA